MVILVNISTKIYRHIHKSDKTSENGVWCLVRTSPSPTLDDLVPSCVCEQLFSQRGLSSLQHIIYLNPVLRNFCGSYLMVIRQENSLLKPFALCLYSLYFLLQKCTEPVDISRDVPYVWRVCYFPPPPDYLWRILLLSSACILPFISISKISKVDWELAEFVTYLKCSTGHKNEKQNKYWFWTMHAWMHDNGMFGKSVITRVDNVDIPGYQDSPPTDCPPRGQSWGGEY